MNFRAKVQAILLCSHAIFAKVKVYPNALDFSADVPVVLTIGTFDGVHHGHRAVIALLKQRAAELNGTSVLLTFDPHPRMVLQPEHHGLRLLNSAFTQLYGRAETIAFGERARPPRDPAIYGSAF